MARASGRAYAFMRWGGVHPVPGLLGQIGWAFEHNDRLGRFQTFYCGSTDYLPNRPDGARRLFWFERCATLPELIKNMSGGPDRSGFDEVKVFDVPDSQSDAAVQAVNQLCVASADALNQMDPVEHTREILARYGVQSATHRRGFIAPFLWYNMLPAKSVPVRKLAVHLFQLRAEQNVEQELTPGAIEDRARRFAQADSQVRSVGECVVARAGGRFVVCLSIGVDRSLTVGQGRSIA